MVPCNIIIQISSCKDKKNPPLSQLEWCRRGEKRENRKGKRKKWAHCPVIQHDWLLNNGEEKLHCILYLYILLCNRSSISFIFHTSVHFGCKYTESSSLHCNIKTSFYPFFYQMCRDTLYLQQKVMNQKNFISNVQICILKDKTGHPIIIYKIKSPKWSHSVILQS